MVKTDPAFAAFTKACGAADDLAMPGVIVAGLLEIVPGDAPLFFDARPDYRTFHALSFATDAPPAAPEFSDRGGLVRWLRVNDDVLVVDDERGPVDDFIDDERRALSVVRARACVPLVTNGRLAAFVMFCGPRGRWTVSRRQGEELMRRARYAAVAWHGVQQRTTTRQHAAVSYRAQQLSTAGQLASAIAHEVRNPLAVIRSAAQFIRDAHPGVAEQDRLLDDVMAEVDRIDLTVDGFLHIGRPHEIAATLVDLSQVVRETTQFVATYARRSQVELSSELGGVQYHVRIDPRELRQVIVNVLLNACQACSSGGHVVIVMRRRTDRGWVELVITDSGHGMAADDLERAFMPFFTTKPNGTGLGLSVCREIVQRHGGAIALASTTGVGTSVVIGFPVA